MRKAIDLAYLTHRYSYVGTCVLEDVVMFYQGAFDSILATISCVDPKFE